MTKKKLPVRFTGQHFTIDKVLIKDAIRQANISNQDTVLDIGAGKGFLTVHLLKIANNVVAIENIRLLILITIIKIYTPENMAIRLFQKRRTLPIWIPIQL